MAPITPTLDHAIRSSIAPLEGWCWDEKAIAMAQLILDTRPLTVVEIGVFGGRSLIPQALALKSLGAGVAYGIDPWRREDALEGSLSEADRAWWATVNLDQIHGGCMRAIWEAGVEEHCLVVRSHSRHCPRLFGGGIDILHVDSCHSEEASTRDVTLYLPQVRAGGHIWFDDINWPTVAKAVSLLDSSCDRLQTLERPGGGGVTALFRRHP